MNEQQEILAKQNFHEEMLKLFKRTAKEVKYKPTRRLDMINKYGGYEAAIKILPTDSNTFDFTLLWEQERLDLSIEALVTKERYRELFPKEVADFCQKRLEEYNYAPKKLMAEPDDMDHFLNSLLTEPIPIKESAKEEDPLLAPKNIHDAISEMIDATKWYELLVNQTVFTPSNRDLIVKIFALGNRGVTLKELSHLEGYSSSYPFYDVMLALCKRVKATLKLEAPTDKEGKITWWAILFTGEVEDKKNFVWFLRKELKEGIEQLMEEGIIPKIEIPHIEHIMEEQQEILPEHIEESLEKANSIESEVNSAPEISTTSEEAPITEIAPPSLEAAIEDQALPTLVEELESPECSDTPEVAVQTSQLAVSEVNVAKVTHLPGQTLESNPKWQTLKEECIDYYGPVCELCGFDFGYTYGSRMDGFIHIHCLSSEKLKNVEAINPQEDLIPICCNCETVMYAKNPPYTTTEIKEMLKENLK